MQQCIVLSKHVFSHFKALKSVKDGLGRHPAALLLSALTLVSEIETCQLFLGQAAAVTRSLIVLTSVTSPHTYGAGRDGAAAGQNWHRPQRAASRVCVCVYI